MLHKSQFQGNPSRLKFIKTDLSQQSLWCVFKYRSLEQRSVPHRAWGLIAVIRGHYEGEGNVKQNKATHQKRPNAVRYLQSIPKVGCCFQRCLSTRQQPCSGCTLSSVSPLQQWCCWPLMEHLASCPPRQIFSPASLVGSAARQQMVLRETFCIHGVVQQEKFCWKKNAFFQIDAASCSRYLLHEHVLQNSTDGSAVPLHPALFQNNVHVSTKDAAHLQGSAGATVCFAIA